MWELFFLLFSTDRVTGFIRSEPSSRDFAYIIKNALSKEERTSLAELCKGIKVKIQCILVDDVKVDKAERKKLLDKLGVTMTDEIQVLNETPKMFCILIRQLLLIAIADPADEAQGPGQQGV